MKNLKMKNMFVEIAVVTVFLLSFACKQKPDGKDGSGAVRKFVITFLVEDNIGGSLIAEVDGSRIESGTEVEKGKMVIFTAKANLGFDVGAWVGAVEDISNKNKASLVVDGIKEVKVKFIKRGFIFPSDGKLSVGNTEFMMKKIKQVSNVNIGYEGSNDNATHSVSLSEYWIGETEVTQGLWQNIMGNNPSSFNGKDGDEISPNEIQEKRPVENITWFECIAFCNKLTEAVRKGTDECVYYSDMEKMKIYTEKDAKENKNVFADFIKKGFRLPTEAEWEWAAGCGDDFDYSGSNLLDEVAWCDGNSDEKTHEVKIKKANSFGLYDMSGNVCEWCWDWYSDSTPLGGENPVGAELGSYRSERGGAWNGFTGDLYIGARSKYEPSYKIDDLGLRVVCRP